MTVLDRRELRVRGLFWPDEPARPMRPGDRVSVRAEQVPWARNSAVPQRASRASAPAATMPEVPSVRSHAMHAMMHHHGAVVMHHHRVMHHAVVHHTMVHGPGACRRNRCAESGSKGCAGDKQGLGFDHVWIPCCATRRLGSSRPNALATRLRPISRDGC